MTRTDATQPSRRQHGTRLKLAWIVAGLLILTTTVSLVLWNRSGRDSQLRVQQARRKLVQGDYAEAEQLAVSAGESSRASTWAWLVAAEAAAKLKRPADALRYYERVPQDAGEAADSATFGAAEMLCHLGRLTDSEAKLRSLLQIDPQHTLAHQRLAFILNITGRRWEATSHLLHVVQHMPGDVQSLLLLGSSERILDAQELLQLSQEAVPEDPLPLLGNVRRSIALNQVAGARQLIERIAQALPSEPEVWVRRGQLLAESAFPQEFVRWHLDIPASVEAHPDTWLVRGVFALRMQQQPVAARCFWEVVRRDPEHRTGHYRLGQVLTDLGERDLAAPFLERAERMLQLTLVLDDLFHHPEEVRLMERAAVLCEGLGRVPEAFGWAIAALRLSPGTAWAENTAQRLGPLRPDLLKQTLHETSLARSNDLSRFPLPDWSPAALTDSSDSDRPDSDATVQFSNDAHDVGIDFEYFNSADPATPGARIFETTGGGVGVFDYDGDGWPDIHLTQGAVWPATTGQVLHLDELFRNRRGQSFQRVTELAGVLDPDFSQGVAAGDFNGDGFQDLYIANLGQNRLWQNNGDGTLTEVTGMALPGAALWTTSCLIADLNNDGFPELFDVNYAAGSQLGSLVCERQGKWRSCSPRAFDAAPDHLWLNLGNGEFEEVSGSGGISVPNGFGLGIIAADFTGNGRLELFVANDEVPNFLFMNQTATGSAVHFTEQALISGVAMDGEGASQGCMGVAADDADGDGQVDLFVTNFYHESNTLYQQRGSGLFSDETRTAGLRNGSFAVLGFGTQFLDAELDGWPDLVVTNGHIDDLTDLGEPWHMPPQYFQNTGGGRFRELPASQLGPFFAGQYLGRGLARLDWNGDGLEDFAVSHIASPEALLTNRTSEHGHFLKIRLRGTRASRDAFGAVVEIVFGDGRTIKKQMTAGDGYQASNQRQLTFGLGSEAQIAHLVVHWPHGPSQTWNDVVADQSLFLVEGHTQAWPYKH